MKKTENWLWHLFVKNEAFIGGASMEFKILRKTLEMRLKTNKDDENRMGSMGINDEKRLVTHIKKMQNRVDV